MICCAVFGPTTNRGPSGRAHPRLDRIARSNYYRDGLKARHRRRVPRPRIRGRRPRPGASCRPRPQRGALRPAAIPTCRPRPTTLVWTTPTSGSAGPGTRLRTDCLSLRTGELAPDSEFYVKESRDLYNAARRDLEAGRQERGGELARSAEAMTHVAEHLAHVADGAQRAVADLAPKRRAPPARASARWSRVKGEAGRAAASSGLPPILATRRVSSAAHPD